MSDPQPAEERRSEIVEAARKLFLSKGYEATSTFGRASTPHLPAAGNQL